MSSSAGEFEETPQQKYTVSSLLLSQENFVCIGEKKGKNVNMGNA